MFRAFGTRNTHEFADVLHDVPSIGRLSLSLPPFLISFLADRFFSLSLRWSIRERSWRGRWQPRHATPSLSLPRILACKSSSIINRGFQEIIEPPNFPSHDDYATLDRIYVNKRARKGRGKTRSEGRDWILLRRIVHRDTVASEEELDTWSPCPSIRRATNEDFK